MLMSFLAHIEKTACVVISFSSTVPRSKSSPSMLDKQDLVTPFSSLLVSKIFGFFSHIFQSFHGNHNIISTCKESVSMCLFYRARVRTTPYVFCVL